MPEVRSYWLNLFSSETWIEFLAAGGDVTGFRHRRWKMVQRMRPGDHLLCYLTGLSRWVGLLEVTSKPFLDNSQIWSADAFPARVRVKPLIQLSPETAVPIFDLRDELSFFRNLTNPNAWTGHLRGSPAKIRKEDALAIVSALKDASTNPVVRPVDKAKQRRISPYLRHAEPIELEAESLFKFPDNGIASTEIEPAGVIGEETLATDDYSTKSTDHTRIQWLLLKLGADMGLDAWVATSDRNKDYSGYQFSSIKNLRRKLPRQFDRQTSRTISQIDVLWIKNDAIIMAFEIESTTAIYSGLLRMSDLLARQPHLNIPLFIVAPEARRDRVVREVNRPTFVSLQTPLRDVCQFISFEELTAFDERIRAVLPSLAVITPDAIQQIASSTAVEEDADDDEK
jgi:hypothetical protein